MLQVDFDETLVHLEQLSHHLNQIVVDLVASQDKPLYGGVFETDKSSLHEGPLAVMKAKFLNCVRNGICQLHHFFIRKGKAERKLNTFGHAFLHFAGDILDRVSLSWSECLNAIRHRPMPRKGKEERTFFVMPKSQSFSSTTNPRRRTATDSRVLWTRCRSRLVDLLRELATKLRGVEKIESALHGSFKWTDLIKQHDHLHVQRGSATHKCQSSLQEVCDILVHPTALPVACSCHTFVCLLRAFVERPTTLNKSASVDILTASDLTILDAMSVLAMKVVPTSLLTDRLEKYILALRHSRDEMDQFSVKSAGRLNRMVSALVRIAKQSQQLWLGVACLSVMVAIIENIDAADISLLNEANETGTKKGSDGEMCLNCQRKIAPLAFSPPGWIRQGLSEMLDENPDEEKYRRTRTESRPFASPRIQCTCPYSDRRPFAKATSFTRVPFDFVLIRSRIYQQLQSTFSFLQVSIPSMKRAKSGLSQLAVAVLEKCLDSASRSPTSPSIRLVLLLVTDVLGPRGYRYLINRLWQRWDFATERKQGGEIYLRILGELLAESHHFGEPKECSKGIEQLVGRLETLQRHGRKGNSTPTHPFLQTFSHIVSRCRLEEKLDCLEGTNKFRRLVESFCDDAFCQTACTEIATPESTKPGAVVEFDGTGCSHWPFPERYGIRAACKRMGPAVVHHRLLSDNCEITPKKPSKRKVSQEQKTPPVHVPPLMDYMNGDVLFHVHSFLGYAELVRAQRVCRSWRDLPVSKILWKQTYRCNYGLLGDEEEIEKTVAQIGSWKNLFVEKYYSEKALKFQYSKAGWKYKTCAYVGCYCVMKSVEQQLRHFKVHEKRILRLQERREAVRERQALKAVKAAEKDKQRQIAAAAWKKRKRKTETGAPEGTAKVPKACEEG